MRHPSENFIKYLLLKDSDVADAEVLKTLSDWGMLHPEPNYLGFLRQDITPLPSGFDPLNRTHKATINFLRKHKVHDLFFPTPEVNEAWDILADPEKRLVVEQILMGRLELKLAAQKVNSQKGWMLTAGGMEAFGRFFWNVKLLTFDEWGRFLFGRSALYERHLALLQAPPQLSYFHLRVQQNVESKTMIQRAQEIAYFTLEEVSQKPGTAPDKVKAIGVLGKTIVDCHEALSTSDMALKDILKQFEKFRMEHPQTPPLAIHQLAPNGNFSGSGAELKEKEPDKA